MAMDSVPRLISRARSARRVKLNGEYRGFIAPLYEPRMNLGASFTGKSPPPGKCRRRKADGDCGAGVAGLCGYRRGKQHGGDCRAFDTRPEGQERVRKWG